MPTGQKIAALLAVAAMPLSKQQIVEWLEVTSEEAVSPEFDALLTAHRVVASERPEDERYWVVKDEQSEVLERIGVDVRSVHERISEAAKSKFRKWKQDRH